MVVLGLLGLSGWMVVTSPIRADTMDTDAQVGFTRSLGTGQSTPPSLIDPNQSNQEKYNSGDQQSSIKSQIESPSQSQLIQTDATTANNRYLPQTDDHSGIGTTVIGATMLTTILTAYGVRRRQQE